MNIESRHSIATIGNATFIAYSNQKPVLVTDPWFGDEYHAYFGMPSCVTIYWLTSSIFSSIFNLLAFNNE